MTRGRIPAWLIGITVVGLLSVACTRVKAHIELPDLAAEDASFLPTWTTLTQPPIWPMRGSTPTGRAAWRDDVRRMISHHHKIRPYHGASASLVEATRKADWMDVTFGVRPLPNLSWRTPCSGDHHGVALTKHRAAFTVTT